MEVWRLLDVGGLRPGQIHSIYEAVAKAVSRGLVKNTLILCYPAERYISIGYHQNFKDEIDVERASQLGIPVVRRQVGGGAVLLDGDQLFYHIVVHRNHPWAKRPLQEVFEWFLRPTVRVYRDYGLPARYKPINDVVIGHRKASGNGAADLEDAIAIVGNVILDFNVKLMAQILRVPDEKFRDKLVKTMEEWVTSLRRELGYKPSMEEVKEKYVKAFEEELGVKLEAGDLLPEERHWMEEIERRLTSREWLMEPASRVDKFRRVVKISEGLYVSQTVYRAGKTLRVILVSDGNVISEIQILGDFFMIPHDAVELLERHLAGMPLNEGELQRRIEEFYREHGVESPGLTPMDIAKAIVAAAPKR